MDLAPRNMFRSLGKTSVLRQRSVMSHGGLHLAGASDIGLYDAFGIEVAYADLFIESPVRQGLARHAHSDRAATSGDYHLISFANHLRLLQEVGRNYLIDDHWSEHLLAHRLINRRKKVLAQLPDVSFTHRNVLLRDNGVALQGPYGGNDIAKQVNLSRNKHSPWGRSFTSHTGCDPADGARALQTCCQFLVAERHAQAWIQLPNFDFIPAFNLTGRQILFYSELKKPLSDADKLVRRCKTVSPAEIRHGRQAQQNQRAQQAAVLEKGVSRICRLCVHDV